MIKRKINNKLDNQKLCPNLDQLFSYIDGTLDQTARNEVERHLNSCPSCLKEMTSIVRDTFSPIESNEYTALIHIANLSQEDQVSRIIAYHEREHSEGIKLQIFGIVNRVIRNVRENLSRKQPQFRPIGVIGMMFILSVTIFLSLNYFRISYPIRQAKHLLKDNYRIYIESARLSGGYRSTGISMLMSADDQSSSYLETAQNHLLKAIHRGAKHQIATQLLAQIYIIEKKYDKADSLINMILSHSSHAASVYNDLGVLYAEEKQWERAADQFQSSITMDNHYCEAYYNLALMKIEMGSTNEAISLLKTYFNFETDLSWKDAAEHLLDEIKRKGEEG